MDEKGVWRTISGRRVFIADGQSITEAMKKSGKFSKTKSKDGEKNTNKRPSKKEIAAKAESLIEEGKKHVDKIYKDLKKFTDGKIEYETTVPNKETGGFFKSTDFKLKTVKSEIRKLNEDLKEQYKHDKYYDLEKISKKQYDVVRFTEMCDGSKMASEFKKTVDRMEKNGYKEVRRKNSFFDYNLERPYRGINCVFEKDGYLFELQFHTPESMKIKDRNHLLYEVARKSSTPVSKKRALALRMYNNSKRIRGIDKKVKELESFNNLKK